MMIPRVGVPAMPARSILPQAYEMFASHLACIRSRPPWACVTTPELAIDYLGVHPQTLWNYKLRRQGPEVEKDAWLLYRGVGKKRTIYRYEAVLNWLPGGEAAAAGRPWHWARCWLHSIGEPVADEPEAVLALVERMERAPMVKARPYAFRRLEHGLARLRAAYGR